MFEHLDMVLGAPKHPPETRLDAIKREVREEFKDAPVMYKIADAESDFDETVKNPKSSATGIFQIVVGTWEHFGCKGNIKIAEHNIECARKIYDKNGTKDWNASKHVWGI